MMGVGLDTSVDLALECLYENSRSAIEAIQVAKHLSGSPSGIIRQAGGEG